MELSSLTEQVESVRSGTTSSSEIVAAYLERARSHEDLNAYTDLHWEEALARAAEIDEQVAAGRDPGPLAGAALALKDLIDHRGHVTTAGSAFYRHAATRSAPVVSRLEDAGAIVLGRTGLHEFAFGFSSENEWFHPVHNPWDQNTSPGGSSGGSAAAVAAGLASASIGTDTGGSVRVPAALCGIVGLKVTHGRVPLTGILPLAASLDTVGPMARSTEDAALMYLSMAGFEAEDPWSVPVPVETPDLERDALEGLVVGVPSRWLAQAPITEQVRSAFEWALARMSELGARLDSLDEEGLDQPGMAFELLSGEVASVHRRWWNDPDAVYGHEVRARLEPAFDVTLDQYIEAQRWRSGLRNSIRRVFDRVDVLATPTVPAMRKELGVDTIAIEGEPSNYRFVLSWFSYLVNHFGTPALALPLMLDGEPAPSLQVIGPWWSEHRLLEIGHSLERSEVCGYRPPPSIDRTGVRRNDGTIR